MAQGNTALLTKSFVASGSVTQYQPVAPGGGNATAASNVIGFATVGGSSGDRIPYVCSGTALAIAGGTIAPGALLEVHTTVTKLVTKASGVGVARYMGESNAADGDVIEVLIVGN